MVDPEEFSKYDSIKPTALDYLANYEDAVKKQEFQIDATTAGARPIVYFPGPGETDPGHADEFNGTRPVGYTSYPNNVLACDMNRPSGTAYYHKPRGSWNIQKIYAVDGTTERSPLIADTDVYVTFKVTGPLLLSPFVFGSGYGKQGFYGIQAMNFQMVLTGNANRAWRCANFGSTKTVSGMGFTNSQLLFQFLTPHASDMLDPRNVVPYYEVPIFKTWERRPPRQTI